MGEGESPSAGGFGDLFSQLQAAQAELEAQAEAIDAVVVEGSAAGGAVVVRLSGALEAESVHIDPAIIDPDDPALLEDAVLAALRAALGGLVELKSTLQAQAEQPFTGGMDLSSIMGNLAVSYTHLDVYKRQHMCRSARATSGIARRSSSPRPDSLWQMSPWSFRGPLHGACLLYTSRCV